MPHLSRQRCWVRLEYWQVDKPKKTGKLSVGKLLRRLNRHRYTRSGYPPNQEKKKVLEAKLRERGLGVS